MGKNLKGKELGKGISQRKDGKYCGRYIDRFGVRKSIYGDKVNDVRKELSEAIYKNSKQISVKGMKFKLDDWFDKWINIYKYDVIRPSTRIHYLYVYENHISPLLGNYYIADISNLQIKEAIKKVGEKGLRYSTQNRMRVMLQDMFDKAMVDEFVMKNPVRGLYLRKPDIERRTLSVEEQEMFFECCKGTFYNNLFVVAVMTGLRAGELGALTWDDISLEENYIDVNKTILYQKLEGDSKKEFHVGQPKTDSSYRKVPINNQCKAVLLKQKTQSKILYNKWNNTTKKGLENLVFTTKFATPINSQIFCDAIDRIVEEINLMRDDADKFEKFSPHCFRRTFATRCYESGIDPRTIQEYLGHATLEMTMQTYTTVFEDFGQKEIKKLDDMTSRIMNSKESEKIVLFQQLA